MPVLRRLTRVEYANSLRDLSAWNFHHRRIATDGQAAGFDNNGDTLSLTPVHLETYLKLARKTSSLVMGSGSSSPVIEILPAPGDQAGGLKDCRWNERWSAR